MFRIIQIAENYSKLTPEFQISNKEIPWAAIKGMRNRIVHDGYPSFQSWALGHMDEVDNLPDWITNLEHKGVIMVTNPLIKPIFKGKVK